MNIGSKLLAAGLLVGSVGCLTEDPVCGDNMEGDAKAALATAVSVNYVRFYNVRKNV